MSEHKVSYKRYTGQEDQDERHGGRRWWSRLSEGSASLTNFPSGG